MLVLTLVWTVVLTPAGVLAARAKAHRAAKADRGGRAHRHVGHRPAVRSTLFGDRIVRYARQLLGVPYSWGGSSPRSGFDCSGFVRFVYQRFGVTLPHSSYADSGYGRGISRAALEPGDLVFFDGFGHVGLYIGSGRFIHAPHAGTRVSVDSISGWYAGRFDGARRLAAPVSQRLVLPPSLGRLARWLARAG
jgi:cell wall-associated NlpC family hydrolase